MWRKDLRTWAPVLACAVVAVSAAGYLLWSRGLFQGDELEDEVPTPSQVRTDVSRKTGRLPVGAIYDYVDVHGTVLAQAVSRLRRNPDATEAMAEALQQYEVLGALLDELKARQDAVA